MYVVNITLIHSDVNVCVEISWEVRRPYVPMSFSTKKKGRLIAGYGNSIVAPSIPTSDQFWSIEETKRAKPEAF